MKFADLIQENYKELSSSQKKVADYYHADLQKAALRTAQQIGEEVGVSDSSVIRFSYKMGYGKFADMQAAVKRELLDEEPPAREHGGKEDGYAAYVNEEKAQLDRLIQNPHFQKIPQIVELLAKADNVVIIGYSSDFAVTYDFYLMLDTARPNVTFCRDTYEGRRRIAELEGDCVALVVALKPFHKDTLMLARRAKSVCRRAIYITNSILDIQLDDEDVVFEVSHCTEQHTSIKLLSSVSVLLSLLVRGIIQKDPEGAQKRITKLDYYIANDEFRDDDTLRGGNDYV